MKSCNKLTLLLTLVLFAGLPHARAAGSTVTLPIGCDYAEDTLVFFSEQAIAHDTDGVVTIRVVPIAYSYNPYLITEHERAENLASAEEHARAIQDVCTSRVVSPATCEASVVDIEIRSDAGDATLVKQLTGDVDGVFFPGGDQIIAMQVVSNTPTETALETLYYNGVPIAGTSAGAAVQSRYMLGGDSDGYSPYRSLERGAVELWYGPTDGGKRGLRFGLEAAVIEQHVLQRGRLLRLLQATQRKPGSKVGLGVDCETVVRVEDNRILTDTVGKYAAVILDEQTHGAAETARYLGPKRILSIHDTIMHVLPPGGYGYDLNTRQPIGGTQAATSTGAVSRNFLPRLQRGAGSLILAGDLSADPTGKVMVHFADLARVRKGPTVVLAAGFTTKGQGIQTAAKWARRLRDLGIGRIRTAVLTATSDLNVLAARLRAAGAVFVTGNDQAAMANQVSRLQALGLKRILNTGRVLLMDNAAAAAAGSWMSAEPTPTEDTRQEQSEDSFLAGQVKISPGLGLIPGAVFEPRVSYDLLYGRLVSHIHRHPSIPTFGIQNGTAIEITPYARRVLGENAVVVMDGRYASDLGIGDNGAFLAIGLLLDTFTPGEALTGRCSQIEPG